MRPVIAFIGKSESGKTTLLEGVISELKQRGYKIGAIKHAHEGFELDKPGKSSTHLAEAGADTVVVSSPELLAVLKKTDHDMAPEEIARLFDPEIDLILTEGYKKSSTMKIEVHRQEQGARLQVPAAQLLAVVTDEHLEVNIPQFTRHDVKPIADLIEKWLAEQPQEDTELRVNSATVPLNRFVKDFMTKTLYGMLDSLKGFGEIRNVQVTLRRKP